MEKLKKILDELVKEMEIKEAIRLRVIPMKHKVASLSFKTKILRLNREVIKILDDEEIRYILIHELVHLKVGSINHGSLFLRELEKHYSRKEVLAFEVRIVKKLM